MPYCVIPSYRNWQIISRTRFLNLYNCRNMERRKKFSGVLAYFHWGKEAFESQNETFNVLNRTLILSCVINLIMQHSNSGKDGVNADADWSSDDDNELVESQAGKVQRHNGNDLRMKSHRKLQKTRTKSPSCRNRSIVDVIRREMTLFEETEKRGLCLEPSYYLIPQSRIIPGSRVYSISQSRIPGLWILRSRATTREDGWIWIYQTNSRKTKTHTI